MTMAWFCHMARPPRSHSTLCCNALIISAHITCAHIQSIAHWYGVVVDQDLVGMRRDEKGEKETIITKRAFSILYAQETS